MATISIPRLPSLLDNDFYKFTMQHGVVKLFPRARARYQFINRGRHPFPPGFGDALREAVAAMSELRLTAEEKKWLAATSPYLDPTYLDFLQGYSYDPAEVTIEQRGEELHVSVEGYWYRTILWEVPLMALISELYYPLSGLERVGDEQVQQTTRRKIEQYKGLGVTIAEFGTRRRHSYQVHQLVVGALKGGGEKTFVGTSNVHLARLHGVKPIGTHAHEWFMFHAARYGFKMANILGLQHWVEVYRGDLGIALSDTYTTEVFLEQFDKMFSKLFDGVRHDSGDPVAFAEKTIRHYERKGIDPLSKTIIFSDALNYEKVARIVEHCRGRIGMSFGIGTSLTNDVSVQPMNMVIKMTETQPDGAQWIPVVKLSDERGKYTGSPEMIELAKKLLQIP
ncbi:nicotinate phosphoribosyltransferase [Cesiribacter andamanensis]|uniref:Nicotinate phosphoribosyltransferase n=1 Tax=Cesiribacter andamanensis AMV16 TaxID=1279009 RepID=M7NXP7_9BACT|nr:nicotinate phosphoribosyltransferase [Cesiribacter andamanensis]EMR03169.1 Nicotinate phosphoribosyltransferase 2 [Cesiribacter andamanensis AMV16]